MQQLRKGTFFGNTDQLIDLDFCTITNTEYTIDKVDWHYHENAYFTFILKGNILERNKKENYYCSPGSLLFHNWQDVHSNIKPPGYTRGFHIEIGKEWYDQNRLSQLQIEGSINIENPDIKILFHHIYRESKILDMDSSTSIQQLLMHIISSLHRRPKEYKNPSWVSKLTKILHDKYTDKLTLKDLSTELSIHPVHLSRDFSKYFHCNLGEYIRKVRIERSLTLLNDKSRSLTDIALECGFADQSHFLRCFKSLNKINPSAFRKPS